MFSLNEEQKNKLATWQQLQDNQVACMQEKEFPYYGASGGAYSYIFTPTSIGLCVQITNNLTKETIDLTDYENW